MEDVLALFGLQDVDIMILMAVTESDASVVESNI